MHSLRRSVVGTGLSVAAALTLSVGIASATQHPAKLNKNCDNATQCVDINQTGTGAALRATATSGQGVYSSTTTGTSVLGTSTSGDGVCGTTEATSSSGAPCGSVAAGVFGMSSSSAAGVSGSSSSGPGVSGTSSTGAGVYGVSPGSFGVQGILQNPGSYFLSGVYGEVDGNPVGSAGVYGIDTSGAAQGNGAYQNAGVQGVSANNVGVFGSTVANVVDTQGSPGGNAYVAAVSAFAGAISGGSSSTPGIGVQAFNGTTTDGSGNGFAAIEMENIGGGNNMIAYSSAGTPTMSLDNAGDLILSGSIMANGVIDCSEPSSDCPAPVGDVKPAQSRSYASRQDVPTMETVGEGQLTNGSARVALGAYASKIDASKNYLVFITPQGQTQGTLYVAGKSPSGFAVREGQGGHSTVAFDYRVVGVPVRMGSSRAVPHGNGKGFGLSRPHAVHFHVRSYSHSLPRH